MWWCKSSAAEREQRRLFACGELLIELTMRHVLFCSQTIVVLCLCFVKLMRLSVHLPWGDENRRPTRAAALHGWTNLGYLFLTLPAHGQIYIQAPRTHRTSSKPNTSNSLTLTNLDALRLHPHDILTSTTSKKFPFYLQHGTCNLVHSTPYKTSISRYSLFVELNVWFTTAV